MRWLWLVLVASAACGRVGFDELTALDAATDAAGDPDAPPEPDAFAPDAAPAVCMNAVCEGAAGELCVTCPDDCATLAAVCGNSQCDPGESATCLADCGPSPWPWDVDEAGFFDRVNFMRSTQHTCPDGMVYPAVPPLTFDAAMTAGTHEWAWEMVHTNFLPSTTMGGCNGRTEVQRLTSYGATGYAWVGIGNIDDAITYFENHITSCPFLMRSDFTAGATAFALDAGRPIFFFSFR